MLDKLRSNKGGVITYVFLGAIIFVFVAYFGPGSYDKGCGAGQGGATWAAQVNGERIPVADFQRGYAGLMRSFQQQAGQAFTRELAEQLGLEGMALNQLVDHALVIQEARRQGLVVTDEELARTIFSLPAFQANGTFDKDAYLRFADNSYGSATRFEKVLREDLLYQHLLAGVRQTVKLSEAEIRDAWTAEHDQVSLQFVRFPLAAAEAEVKPPSDAEAAALAAKAPARVEAAFREQAARFDQPRKVKARQLVAKVAPGASPADEDKGRLRADALAGRVAREDFAAVARQASEDEATKARGGDLGVLSEGLVEKAFADAVFPLAAGAVTKPFRTAAGWTVVKVEEVIPAKKVTLDQARPELARELLLKDRARALVAEKAAAALAAARAGKALGDLFPGAEAAKKAGHPQVKLGTALIAAESTGLFGAGASYVPRLGAAPELVTAALAGSAGQVLGQVFETTQGAVVAVVEKREKPDPAQFQAQKDAVAERLRGKKAQQVEQAWLKGLRDAADVKVNPAMRSVGPPEEG